MRNIIDDPIQKYRAILCFYSIVSMITLQKYQLLKHVKRIKKSDENAGQKPLLRIKR